MRISIVLGPFQPLPPAGIGAVEKVWSELAREFCRAGHEVRLVGKVVPGSLPAAPPQPAIVAMRGHTATRHLWNNLAKDLWYSLSVIRRLGAGDVIVTNSFWLPVVLGFLSPRAGRIVVHVARFPKGQMWLYGRAKTLHAISSAVCRAIVRQSPGLRDRVRVLPYPVDLHAFRPPVVDRRYDGESTILFVGRVHPEKGIELLLHAFRKVALEIPLARLKIVGPASIEAGGAGEPWLGKLKQLAEGLRVEFAGPISGAERLAAEYRGAHCFCYPSQSDFGEAFGLSVLEAMAAGMPVVVSDLECFRDLLKSGQEGLVFDHRAQSPDTLLAGCLVQILSNGSLARQMGENARKRAGQFSIEILAPRYLRMLEEAAGSQ